MRMFIQEKAIRGTITVEDRKHVLRYIQMTQKLFSHTLCGQMIKRLQVHLMVESL